MEISATGCRGLGGVTGIQKQPSELTVPCQQVLRLTETLAEAGHRRGWAQKETSREPSQANADTALTEGGLQITSLTFMEVEYTEAR